MPTRRLRALTLALVTFSLAPAPPAAEKPWVKLFNGKDLSGLYTFLQTHGRNSDPDKIVTIEDGAIHLYKHAEHGSKVVMGYIGTEKEYGNYHLRFEYKWGTKKFEPRLKLRQDAGLYYHIIGDDAVWPKALQYQVEATNVGDIIALYGYQLDSTHDPKTAGEPMTTYLPADQGGVPRILGGKGIAYQKHLAKDHEKDGWNVAEIIAKVDTTSHILNGHVINAGKNIRVVGLDPAKPNEAVPHAKGRIALEIEAAEIFFRNFEIQSLD